ncbi:MAG: 6-phosphogluconolactonase [Chloroflexales bacterium]|nr:6-phosphogluconolactonase [Chloroflexales bacterium]
MPGQPDIIVLPDAEAVQQQAAEHIVALVRERVASTGRFLIVLSGGSTPQGLYRRLVQAPLCDQIPWAQLWVLWGDERYVPADHPDSLLAMARETLLDHAPIPPEQIFPIATHYSDPSEAASAYEQQVRALLDRNDDRFDLVLLGMGPDGHTASLFPRHPALMAPEDTLVVAVAGAPKPPPQRISLTYAALNRAAHTLVLVTGADKAAAVRAALRGPYDPQHIPIQGIAPLQGAITWMLDVAAAQQLNQSA